MDMIHTLNNRLKSCQFFSEHPTTFMSEYLFMTTHCEGSDGRKCTDQIRKSIILRTDVSEHDVTLSDTVPVIGDTGELEGGGSQCTAGGCHSQAVQSSAADRGHQDRCVLV